MKSLIFTSISILMMWSCGTPKNQSITQSSSSERDLVGKKWLIYRDVANGFSLDERNGSRDPELRQGNKDAICLVFEKDGLKWEQYQNGQCNKQEAKLSLIPTEMAHQVIEWVMMPVSYQVRRGGSRLPS